MKKLLFFTALCLFISSPVLADSAKIVFFNMNGITAACDAYKTNMQEVQKTFAREAEELQNEERELQYRYTYFKNSRQRMSADERNALNMDLMHSSRIFEDKNNAFKRKRSAAENVARNKAEHIIDLAVEAVGKKHGYTAILNSDAAGAMFVNKSADVTDEILKEANQIWHTQQNNTRN